MGLGGALLVVTGVVVVFVNVVATLRLWRSAVFERPQKVAQTILMWLVPGSVIIVWNLLGEPRIGGQRDATAGGIAFVATDWLLGSPAYHRSNAGHHNTGGDGGGYDGNHGNAGHGGGGGYDGGGGSGGDGGGGDP